MGVRILIFGLDCEFTTTFAQSLLEAGAPIIAIVLPGPPGLATPIRATPAQKWILMHSQGAPPTGLLALADPHRIPVWRVGDLRSRRTIDFVKSIQADLVVCACFNQKIGAEIVGAFEYGGLNVHPSLLPDKRGPDPQFWTLKDGTGATGVTIHRLINTLDAGPILAQQALSYPDGTTEIELDALTASTGARLFLNLLPSLQEGCATYAPFPTVDDFKLDLDRPARTAHNFVRGIAGRGVPIRLDWQGTAFHVLGSLGYADEPHSSVEDDRSTRWVPFNPGWAKLRLKELMD